MERKRRPWARKARWIFYPLLIGAIVFLVLTQQHEVEPPIDRDYNSRIELEQRYLTAEAGERVPLLLKIKNRGKKAWRSDGEFPCFLSYHLYLRENYRTVRFDNRRFPLPGVIEPGKTFQMEIALRAPIEAQRYILMFDMVREGQSWFRDHGSRTAIVALDITEKEWPEDKTAIESGQPGIDKLVKIIRLTLDQNEVVFQGKTGKIAGFAAGTDYPQIWLRDANTILNASRYYYGQDFLSTWLEEHLAFQKENGSLEDWIDSRGESDKNTTETDQESSAVQAAFQVYGVLGAEWLTKTIAGQRIIGRLDRALSYVLENRWNDRYGLLTGAHTADWGDVDMVDSDQQAVYTDDRTHWTVDIYDQSMFYQACRELAEMMEALGNAKRGAFWEEKAKAIKQSTDRWLWQEDKGFYRVHLHLDDLEHDFDEADMFAMGGNVQAVIGGLADEGKSRRIIEEALERQETYGVSTISGILLPPYPKGLFKHPLLDDPYEYQNGAQWDWFGGRLIYAMFENGFSELAKEKLMEIIAKNVKNRGFFEWDNKDGVGRGSDFYAGSAGSLGKALVEGYFGINLRHNHLSIEPKLGKDSGNIHVIQPPNALFVAYEYTFDKDDDKLTMKYNSNFLHEGSLKILNPWLDLDLKKDEFYKILDIRIDGKNSSFQLSEKKEDVFIMINTDFQSHILEIILKK